MLDIRKYVVGQIDEFVTAPHARATSLTQPTDARRMDGWAAAISWIDPKSPAGNLMPDDRPPNIISPSAIFARSHFRYANFLHPWIETIDGVTVSDYGYYDDSGCYAGPSFAGIASLTYPVLRSSALLGVDRPEANGAPTGVIFEQTVGARTVSPETLGGVAGLLAGVVGEVDMAAIGQSKLGGILPDLGETLGKAVADLIFNFPPIWTRLVFGLTVMGARPAGVMAHSIFPSMTAYLDGQSIDVYDAADQQASWQQNGWDSGNPWNVPRPIMTQK